MIKKYKNVKINELVKKIIKLLRQKNDNIIIITTGINKENYKLCIDAIKCEIKNIENGNFTSSHLENCKTLIKSILL